MRTCARCGHVQALHDNPHSHVLTRPPVCREFERKAPWPLRVLTWLLGRALR